MGIFLFVILVMGIQLLSHIGSVAVREVVETAMECPGEGSRTDSTNAR
jgi:hypothetical protein